MRKSETVVPAKAGTHDFILDPARGEAAKALFVAGHGAGSHMDHPSMRQLSSVLTRHGFDVVRFNFDYREKGSRARPHACAAEPFLSCCRKNPG